MEVGSLSNGKEVVATNTTPVPPDLRKESLRKWIIQTQTKLAYRSRLGKSFHKLRNLFVTKRLIDVSFVNVLDNKGAKTAGVDGISKKDFKTERSKILFREEIYQELKVKSYKPQPVRRTYIPKPNGKMRPLGIPTMKDRVIQEMLRLILEPIYETEFYAHSYGFRPYRCTHHAVIRVKNLSRAHGNYSWAVEGDIEKCFDSVDHGILLKILRRRIKDGFVIRLIRDQLKAGIMDAEQFYVSEEGTPQGGIVSPLLANLYLHELDEFVANKYEFRSQVQRHYQRGTERWFGHLSKAEADILSLLWDGEAKTIRELSERSEKNLTTYYYAVGRLVEKGLAIKEKIHTPRRKSVYHLRITSQGKSEYLKARHIERERQNVIPCYIVRYADDFVIMTKSREDAEEIRLEVEKFLQDKLKLRLSKEKTVITHMDQGINFLGFEIKTYPGYSKGACLIKPSKDRVKAFKRKIKAISQKAWSAGKDAGDIAALNRLMIGWGNYYRRVSSAKVFRQLDQNIWFRVFWDSYRAQKGSAGQNYSRRKHYLKNYIPYKWDIKVNNRWRKGRNFGRWVDENRTCAYILIRLAFLPIQYVDFHPQLNPYFPEERVKLDENRRLLRLLYDLRTQSPAQSMDAGPDGLELKIKALKHYWGRCALCGKGLKTVRFLNSISMKHRIETQSALYSWADVDPSIDQIPLCPACYKTVERD